MNGIKLGKWFILLMSISINSKAQTNNSGFMVGLSGSFKNFPMFNNHIDNTFTLIKDKRNEINLQINYMHKSNFSFGAIIGRFSQKRIDASQGIYQITQNSEYFNLGFDIGYRYKLNDKFYLSVQLPTIYQKILNSKREINSLNADQEIIYFDGAAFRSSFNLGLNYFIFKNLDIGAQVALLSVFSERKFSKVDNSKNQRPYIVNDLSALGYHYQNVMNLKFNLNYYFN